MKLTVFEYKSGEHWHGSGNGLKPLQERGKLQSADITEKYCPYI